MYLFACMFYFGDDVEGSSHFLSLFDVVVEFKHFDPPFGFMYTPVIL